MSYLTFNEFVKIKEDLMNQQGVVPGVNPMLGTSNPQKVLAALTKLQTTPPPAGTNPLMYQNRIRTAKQLTPTARPTSVQQAIDLATAQQKAATGQ